MRQIKIVTVIALALIIQSSLRGLPGAWGKYAAFLDFALIVAVYFALQRDAIQALTIAFVIGLGMDALGSGLLGANSFSLTLISFLIVTFTTRVMLLENALVRIPVLAGATLCHSLLYYALQRVFQQKSAAPFVETATLKLIGTTIVGTLLLIILERLFSERSNQHKQFAFRRRVARRSLARIGRRR